jgi:hypothetical protein
LLAGALELMLGTGDERVEIEAREPRVAGKGAGERLPQRPLPGDAGLQSFQLDEAAERRIASQPPVQLQPGRLLGDPSACRLRGRDVHVERPHDGEQRPPVLRDLAVKALEERADRRSPVALPRPPRELDADGGAGEVIVQVDVELPHREHAASIPGPPVA